MAWTGFGGTWTDGEHHGGDSSGSIGGGGIKLDGNGNPMGIRAPNATEVAAQFNSYGGVQISPSSVSNIRSDGEGGYAADIKGMEHTVSVGNSPYTSNTAPGFTGIVTPLSNGGKGVQGGMSNCNDASNAVRAGKIPSNFKLQGRKIGIMAPKYRRISTGHGESYQQQIGEGFLEVPALTKAYQEGVKERTVMQEAIKLTSDFYKEVGLKYGAKQSAIAQDLAAAAKGKAMKNVDQAMAAFTKIRRSWMQTCTFLPVKLLRILCSRPTGRRLQKT
ncbi:colicin-like pore-forming protein [Enterobacter sp.]|uniref:colicin-like pore-forming protein n=1 Tax=Enterobacter sp. TaxID=42895 RepID=UPI00296EC6CC|nr:colicin-like pore-forming protein [Enterobacter sp.]